MRINGDFYRLGLARSKLSCRRCASIGHDMIEVMMARVLPASRFSESQPLPYRRLSYRGTNLGMIEGFLVVEMRRGMRKKTRK